MVLSPRREDCIRDCFLACFLACREVGYWESSLLVWIGIAGVICDIDLTLPCTNMRKVEQQDSASHHHRDCFRWPASAILGHPWPLTTYIGLGDFPSIYSRDNIKCPQLCSC